MEVARHVQSTKNRKLEVNNIATAFVFYCDAYHLDIL